MKNILKIDKIFSLISKYIRTYIYMNENHCKKLDETIV
jgi:hypothetical protein